MNYRINFSLSFFLSFFESLRIKGFCYHFPFNVYFPFLSLLKSIFQIIYHQLTIKEFSIPTLLLYFPIVKTLIFLLKFLFFSLNFLSNSNFHKKKYSILLFFFSISHHSLYFFKDHITLLNFNYVLQ